MVLAVLSAFLVGAGQTASPVAATVIGYGPGDSITGILDGERVTLEARVIEVEIEGEQTFAYCIEAGQPLRSSGIHLETSWEDSGSANLPAILAVLEAFPPGPDTDPIEAMAVQAAIWHFSDGFSSPSSTNGGRDVNGPLVQTFRAAVAVGNEAIGTDDREPGPTLSLHLHDEQVVAGALHVAVVRSNADVVDLWIADRPGSVRVLDCASRAEIVSVEGDPDGREVCVQSDGTGEAHLVAAARGYVPAGRAFVAPNNQTIVLAAATAVGAEASIPLRWEAPPAELSLELSAPAAVELGGSISYEATLAYVGPELGPTVTVLMGRSSVAGAVDIPRGCEELSPMESCSLSYTSDPITVQSPIVTEILELETDLGIVMSATAETAVHRPALSLRAAAPTVPIESGTEASIDVWVIDDSSSGSPPLVPYRVSVAVGEQETDVEQSSWSHCTSLVAGVPCAFDLALPVGPETPVGPLDVTITVLASPEGSSTSLRASADVELDITRPALTLVRESSGPSRVGQPAQWDLRVTNTGDSPLTITGLSDEAAGDALPEDGRCELLAHGEECVVSVEALVPPEASDPWVGSATVTGSTPSGLVVEASASGATELFQPALAAELLLPAVVEPEGSATAKVTLRNESSDDAPDLELDSVQADGVADPLAAATTAGCARLEPGAVCSFDVEVDFEGRGHGDLEVVLHATAHSRGFADVVSTTATATTLAGEQRAQLDVRATRPSAAGEPVTFDVSVLNTSTLPVPLVVRSVEVSGVEHPDAAAGCDELARGRACDFSITTTVPAGAEEPWRLPVRVTVEQPEADRAPLVLEGEVVVELFQPRLAVAWSGPTSATVGVGVEQVLTIRNLSSIDAPALELVSVVDTGTGWAGFGPLTEAARLAGCSRLAAGASCQLTVVHPPASDVSDPTAHETVATARPVGYTQSIVARGSRTLRLIAAEAPAIDLRVAGDALGVAGADISTTLTVSRSDASTSTLELASVEDSVLGDLYDDLASSACLRLEPGERCSVTLRRTLPADAPDPVVRSVTIRYDEPDTERTAGARASHEVELFQPSLAISVAGPEEVVVGRFVSLDVTVTNDSSADSPPLELAQLAHRTSGVSSPSVRGARANRNECESLVPGMSCRVRLSLGAVAADVVAVESLVTATATPTGFALTVVDEALHRADVTQVAGISIDRPTEPAPPTSTTPPRPQVAPRQRPVDPRAPGPSVRTRQLPRSGSDLEWPLAAFTASSVLGLLLLSVAYLREEDRD